MRTKVPPPMKLSGKIINGGNKSKLAKPEVKESSTWLRGGTTHNMDMNTTVSPQTVDKEYMTRTQPQAQPQ